jgi:TetR/AcrR family tetracycline transcriptional repressor
MFPGGGQTSDALGRERIVETALRIADVDGIYAVSMHRVAKELSVGSMTLYTYVDGKEDLMDAVASAAVESIRLPDPTLPWDARVRELARETVIAASAHPSLPGLLMVRPPSTVAALRPLEFMLQALRDAGVEDQDAARIAEMQWALIGGILVGDRTGVFDRSAEEPILHRAVEDGNFPNITALGHLLFGGAQETLEFSLDIVIAGIRARIVR